MQCPFIRQQPFDVLQTEVETLDFTEAKPIHFQAHFQGWMDMYHDVDTVADYLNAHEGWFCRCAQPMTVESLGENGYILTVGRFSNFGYEVEPKMAVVLHPPQDRLYLMNSIPIPDYIPPGYHVDYHASLELLEIPVEQSGTDIIKAYKKKGWAKLPEQITRVTWQLELGVVVQFPKFIYKLPLSFIQSAGDRVLIEIVRQVSPRLTCKVQKDFHAQLDLPLPSKNGSKFQVISQLDEQVA
jgi:hypothetical protein